jgi:hypothetical protein
MKNIKKFESFGRMAPKSAFTDEPTYGQNMTQATDYTDSSFEQQICDAAASGDMEAVSMLVVEPEFDRDKLVDHLVSIDCRDLTTLQTIFTLFPEMEDEFAIKKNFRGYNEGIMDFLKFNSKSEVDDKPDWENDCLKIYELNGDYHKFKRLMGTGAGDIVTDIDFKAHLQTYPGAKFYVFCAKSECYFVGIDFNHKKLTTFIGQHGVGPNIEEWLADCGIDWMDMLHNPPAEIQ